MIPGIILRKPSILWPRRRKVMSSFKTAEVNLANIGICSGNLDFVKCLIASKSGIMLNIVFNEDASMLKQVVKNLHHMGCRQIFIDGSDLTYLGLLRWGVHFFTLEGITVTFFNSNAATQRYVQSLTGRNEFFNETISMINETIDPNTLLTDHILASVNASHHEH